MILFEEKVYFSNLVKYAFLSIIVSTNSYGSSLSVLVEDDDCVYIEEMEDGTIREWPIRPGSTVDIPDNVEVEFTNESKYDPMIIIEEDSPDLPLNLDHAEKVRVVESESGDIGYEKTSTDGKVKLITSAQNHNKLYSNDNQQTKEQDSASDTNQASTNKEQSEKKKPYSYVRTITKLPPKEVCTPDWGWHIK